jgi:hypothetical protein
MNIVIIGGFFGQLAQLVRALDSHSRGRGFEPLIAHQGKTLKDPLIARQGKTLKGAFFVVSMRFSDYS